MRFSVLSIAIVLSVLASSGLGAAIPETSSTATIPRPVAALWKNRIHQEVNPKARTVDSIAPPEATSVAGEFEQLLEPAARDVTDSSIPTPVGAIWKDRPECLLDSELSWTTTIATIGAILVFSRVVKLVEGIKAVGSLPGLRIPAEPLSILGILLPETEWNPGLLFTWTWRKNRNVYRHYGRDTVSIVPFIHGAPTLYTRSMKVTRQVITAGHNSGAFGKSDSMGRSLLFWGPNIVATEGEQWRKYRKIATPAFNNETCAFVWEASQTLYAEMVSAEGWSSKDVIEVPSIQALTFKFTLIIIASVGFGLPFTWSDSPARQGEMTVQECFQTIMRTTIFAITAPEWAWKLPVEWSGSTHSPRLRHNARIYAIPSQRPTRRYAIQGRKEAARDIFSLLVRASEEEGGKMSLDDKEVIGNVFSFMLAGHETTAYTLSATLGFLALNQGVQDEIVAQVQDVTGESDHGVLLLEDYGKLDKVLAAFYEGTRLFPSGVFLVREAKQDTVLNVSDDEESRMLPVKKGTHIVVDMVGVQYNPRYFADPEEFRPSRWYKRNRGDANEKELSESEEYTAFSHSPLANATSQGLALVLDANSRPQRLCASSRRCCADWRVEPLLATKPDGKVETQDEWRERVMQATMSITMGIKDVPLRIVRRV
ncbi:cytochrome P450 [Melanogaster broomeanus]|nr:cytochrome P450 [Melanogaster broomeanus]